MTYKKKLIEVALPLKEINEQSAREKSIRHGHPSTLHLWWARRPLAACRAVLFASLVDDPSANPDKFPTEEAQEIERERLFDLIKKMVKWENTTNKKLFKDAHEEILKSTDGNPPPVLDPFCGGGSIPLEAQRLGLEAHGSDLNPVAVLITKALIEIPPKFAGKEPVNPEWQVKTDQEKAINDLEGAQGLADDVRYYGKWMRDEAFKHIGHLYPKVKLPSQHGHADSGCADFSRHNVKYSAASRLKSAHHKTQNDNNSGGEATVIAWIWARTVKCPNPACGAQMPLVTSFWLSKKKGKEAWIEPIIDKKNKTVSFEVRTGRGIPQDGTVNRSGGKCIFCDSPVPFKHIRAEGRAGRMSAQLMAIVAEGKGRRIYIAPEKEHVKIAESAKPENVPDTDLPEKALGFRVQQYGMVKHKHLFTPRQLVALTTFSDLVSEAHEKIISDAIAAGMKDDGIGIEDGGLGARAYADGVATYLAFLVDQLANHQSTICSWNAPNSQMRNVFARQAIPMTWDYAESNPFCESSGSYNNMYVRMLKGFHAIPASSTGFTRQIDATDSLNMLDSPLISTDPPYYDNIGYADLSDFFYIWLKRSLSSWFPKIFTTLLTPKSEELVATPYRFDGDKKKSETFFESGLRKTFNHIQNLQNSKFPISIYYAFKQSESDESVSNTSVVYSTGWETMLDGLITTKMQIFGTWPMRTEKPGRSIGIGTNALASSIILVCRPRPEDAPLATRKEFINELKKDLPDAIKKLTQANIAPVDLAQSAIGPGMAVFSRYSKVLETDGTKMSVRTALGLINERLDEIMAEYEGDFDADTRWAVAWFEQHGHKTGPYGEAETYSKAKNVGIDGLVKSGILESKAGKVRLLLREELESDWDPKTDDRLTIWEVTQHLILKHQKEGDEGAASLLRQVGSLGESARDLAYRLYQICDRKKWAQEALAYNSLVISWSQISELAGKKPVLEGQTEFDL